MRYCARWRMRVAANMLRDGKQSASNVAYSVGFNSEAAFTRAFKREYGVPPATWRRQFEEEAKSREEAQRIRDSAAGRAVCDCKGRDPAGLCDDGAGASAGEGCELAQPSGARLEEPCVAALAAGVHDRSYADPLRRAGERAVRLGHAGDFVRGIRRRSGVVVDAAGLEQVRPAGNQPGRCRWPLPMPFAIPTRSAGSSFAAAMRRAGWCARRSGRDGPARGDDHADARPAGERTIRPIASSSPTSTFPSATPEQHQWFNEVQRVSASPENAVRLQRVFAAIDVRDLLRR